MFGWRNRFYSKFGPGLIQNLQPARESFNKQDVAADIEARENVVEGQLLVTGIHEIYQNTLHYDDIGKHAS